MSDPTGTPAAVPPAVPVATPPPVVPPAAPAAPAVAPVAAAPAAPVPPAVDADPVWLPERLKRAKEQAAEQERKELLKKLGIDDPEKAAQIIAEAKQREEKEKTLAQKYAEAEARTKALTERNAHLEAATAATAKREMATLTDEQRDAVKNLAGDDPAAQVRTISALVPTWKSIAPATTGAPPAAPLPPAVPAAPAAPAVPPPIAPPINTAPPAAPTPPPATQSTTNHLAVYEGLLKMNPIRAANYLDMNWAAIDAAKKARAG